MQQSIGFLPFARHLNEAYASVCQPLCRQLQMTRVSFDIIMFLSNNPEMSSARDIQRMRGIKPNLLSMNIDKLVTDGYLLRCEVPGDRRLVRLELTERARAMAEAGREVQISFLRALFEDISQEQLAVFRQCMEQIDRNALRLSGQGAKKQEEEGTQHV